MAMATGNYNYETYGKGFNLMPEGVHEFGVVSAQQTFTKRGGYPQWELLMQPINQQYQNDNGYKVWLFEDGCVEAIYDAMGRNPASVDMNKDYQPEAVVGVKLQAEVIHVESEKDDGTISTFANIKRLYPAFNMARTQGAQSAPNQQLAPQPAVGGFGAVTGAQVKPDDGIPF